MQRNDEQDCIIATSLSVRALGKALKAATEVRDDVYSSDIGEGVRLSALVLALAHCEAVFELLLEDIATKTSERAGLEDARRIAKMDAKDALNQMAKLTAQPEP